MVNILSAGNDREHVTKKCVSNFHMNDGPVAKKIADGKNSYRLQH